MIPETSANNPPWTLTVPSDCRQLGLVRAFVEGVCRSGGVSQSVIDAAVLATHEAAGNIIRHAHDSQPNATLQVQCRVADEYLEIRLLDEGQPFDPAAFACPDPAEVRPGGRGLFLIKSLMDEVTCQQRGERGNTLRLVKRCVRNSQSSDIR